MVRNFKGQVKISDIQAEFDALVTSINDAIDAYNSSEYIKDIDYNDASSDIAPIGYTLTIGALKKILEMYKGQVIGCKVFEDLADSNNIIISNGLYFSDKGAIVLPSKVIQKGIGSLFYNPTTQEYKISGWEINWKTFNQPILYGNTDWGVVSATLNNDTAWKALDGYPAGKIQDNTNHFWQYLRNNQFEPITETWQWVFQETLKIETLRLNANIYFGGSPNIVKTQYCELYTLDDELITRIPEQGDLPVGLDEYVEVPLNNRELNGIKIKAHSETGAGTIGEIKLIAQSKQLVPTSEVLDDNWIFITNINSNREIPLYNSMTFDNGITENYKIACQNLMTSREINMVPDTSEKAKFVSGNEADMHQGQGRAETYFKGELVAYNQQTGSRNCSYYVNNNHLLLPKGIANPYTHNKGSNDKVFEVIINNGSEDEEAE